MKLWESPKVPGDRHQKGLRDRDQRAKVYTNSNGQESSKRRTFGKTTGYSYCLHYKGSFVSRGILHPLPHLHPKFASSQLTMGAGAVATTQTLAYGHLLDPNRKWTNNKRYVPESSRSCPS